MKHVMKLLIVMSAITSVPALADMQQDIAGIQHAWAKANYDTSKDQQVKAFEELVKRSQSVKDNYPDQAEPVCILRHLLLRQIYSSLKQTTFPSALRA